jgi:creatinine amidohydrolase
MLAIDSDMVDWDQAKAEYPHTPAQVENSERFNQDAGFSKTIKFDGYQVFLPQENSDYSYSSTVGNPERATAEKGQQMLDRFITITADLANELKKLDPKPHTTQFPDRM